MAYIGNVPSHGEFKKADSIVSSFNGTLTQFDLDYDTVNQTVGDATQLIVSLNGIIQEPGTAYTLGIGGGSIVFASAPASTDTCHIVLLGGVGGTTTPTDGSVTASKLDSALKDYLEETFTADGTQTVFTLTRAVVGANTLLVTIDGIVQPSSAFTASGTTLTISEVLAATTNVRVVHMGVKAGVYVPANDSVTADMLANSINTDIAAGVAALPKAGGAMTGAITTNSTFDGRDVATDGTKLDAIEASADVTDTANVTAAGALMDSELTNLSAVKAINQSLVTTTSPQFAGLNVTAASGLDAQVAMATTSNGRGFYVDESDANSMKFYTGYGKGVAGKEVTLDNFGNLLVGKTASSGSTQGAQLQAAGNVFATVTNDYPLYLNRLGTEGTLAQFRKAGTLVGSIDTQGNRLSIGSGDVNLNFNASANSIYPISAPATGALSDGIIDVGAATARFKDLYLSGGAYLGGTGAANKLYDYETGTFNLTLVGYYGNPSTQVIVPAAYTKIGNTVYFRAANQSINNTSYAGNMWLSGLPFATIGHPTVCTVTLNGIGTYPNSSPFGSVSGYICYIYKHVDQAAATAVFHNVVTNGGITITGSYQAT